MVHLFNRFTCLVAAVSGLAVVAFAGEGDSSVGILPADYLRVDWVETAGAQYIDTGYFPGPSTRFEADVKMVGDYRSSVQSVFCGAKTADGKTFFVNFSNVNANEMYVWCKSANQTTEVVTGAKAYNGQRVTLGFDATTGTFSYGGLTRQNCSVLTETLTTSFGIGGRIIENESPVSPFASFRMRIYGWKIWTGEKLERDYVPCVRERDDVAGLYDLQNGVFKPSAGDPFVAGGGVAHSVLAFSGKAVTDCITFDYCPSLSNFSASAWVKNVTPGSFHSAGTYLGVIFSQGALGAIPGFVCCVSSGADGTCSLKCQVCSGAGVVTSAPIDWTAQTNDDKWHLVTVTYDKSSGQCCLYVDAEFKNSVTLSTEMPVSTSQFVIGARDTSKDTGGYPVKGCVAEVSLWNRVLKPREVKKMLYRQLSGKESGLLGYWPLTGTADDLTTYVAVDCVDNGNVRHNGTWGTGIDVTPGRVGFWRGPGMAVIIF